MYDPFLPLDDISTAEVLELIINHQFIEPIYHTDGFGHVQIEEPLQATPYSIRNLIHLVEIKQQWSALIKRLPNKSEWWFGISPEGFGSIAMLINFIVSIVVMKFTKAPPKEVQDIVENIRIPSGAGEAVNH